MKLVPSLVAKNSPLVVACFDDMIGRILPQPQDLQKNGFY
jgi:hypothetical protein